jgi:GNAT superfamily N-acetyltransferase
MWSGRSRAGKEFGGLVPVRPTTSLSREHCPWGHDLLIGGRTRSYSHFLCTHVEHCDACYAAGRRGEWIRVDPTRQHQTDTAPTWGLALVVIPPPVRAGVGQIRVHLEGVSVGDIDIALCAVDRRAVIEQVRVDEDYRRLGLGRLLVAAAISRAPRYDWSTTSVTTREARAFWAAVGEPTTIGEPHWCTHMRQAAERLQ